MLITRDLYYKEGWGYIQEAIAVLSHSRWQHPKGVVTAAARIPRGSVED